MDNQMVELKETQKFCRTCGNGLKEGQDVCTACGFKPLAGSDFCQECGANTRKGQELCTACGFRLKGGTSLPVAEDGMPVSDDFRGFESYWQHEFNKIQQSNESYKGKWNWPAFFFGPLWALSKGVWLAALVSVIASMVTAGIAAPVFWVIFGIRGNYMHYCKVAKRKQLPI